MFIIPLLIKTILSQINIFSILLCFAFMSFIQMKDCTEYSRICFFHSTFFLNVHIALFGYIFIHMHCCVIFHCKNKLIWIVPRFYSWNNTPWNVLLVSSCCVEELWIIYLEMELLNCEIFKDLLFFFFKVVPNCFPKLYLITWSAALLRLIHILVIVNIVGLLNFCQLSHHKMVCHCSLFFFF